MLAFFSALALSSIKLLPSQEKSFISWMRRNNNYYNGDEYHFRLGIFLANQKYVQEHNSNPNKSFKLEMNNLAVLTPSEYKLLLGFKPNLSQNRFKKLTIARILNSLN